MTLLKVDKAGRRVPLRWFEPGAGTPVLFLAGNSRTLAKAVEDLRAGRRGGPRWVVYLMLAWHASPAALSELLGRVRAATVGQGDIDVRLMCNSTDYVAAALAVDASVRTVLVHQNVFINDRLFAPADGPAEFDAVLNAKPSRFKRHGLAARVQSLMLLSYTDGDGRVDLRQVRARARYRNLPLAHVAAQLRRCRVGLALSAVEGGNYATTEYLLTGLPVVTTPARGGRLLFLDERTSLTVEPEAEAVATGVRAALHKLADGSFEPPRIRRRAQAQIRAMRGTLAGDIATAVDADPRAVYRRLLREIRASARPGLFLNAFVRAIVSAD